MGFGIINKNCAKCGCEFATHDDRVNYCEDCYLDEFEPFGELEGGLDEKQALASERYSTSLKQR